MNNFALILSRLALSITQNNLDTTKKLVDILNQDYLNNTDQDTETDTWDFITARDIYSLETENDSFLYFLNNYKPENEEALRAIWDIQTRLINSKYIKKEITDKELTDFIMNAFNDFYSPIREYRYNNLIRLALTMKDYSLIVKIKEQMENMEQ